MLKTASILYDLRSVDCRVCYPPVTLRNNRNSADSLKELFPESWRHVVYSGALGDKQNPEGLLSLFRFASHRIEKVMFHIFSRGHLMDALKANRLDKHESDRIKFHDLVAEKDLPELYMRSDVQIIPQTPGACVASLP